MKNVVIYGSDIEAETVRIECEKQGFRVEGFVDVDRPNLGNLDGYRVYSFESVVAMYIQGCIDGIVLPRGQDYYKRHYWGRFLAKGVKIEDLYLSRWLREDRVNFVKPLIQSKYLAYLEVHLCDHCNMNCAYCEHYSPLVKKEVFPNTEKIKHGLTLLKKYIDDIGLIRLLGGEPLLNEDINEIISFVRMKFPYARIKVVTNGIKLFNMNDDFFDTLQLTDSGVDVSLYPALKKSKGEIVAFFEKKGIAKRSFCTDVISHFSKKQVLEPHDKREQTFFHCYQGTCNNLYEDKLGVCFLPFTTHYFNEYFNMKEPENEYLDLNDKDLTTEKIRKFLFTPIERCRYCELPFDDVRWRKVAYPSVLDDWVK